MEREAWRVRSKHCCSQKLLPLIFLVFLLFLAISVMTLTNPLPMPPADFNRRLSRALSSAGEFGSRLRLIELCPAVASQQPVAHIQHRAWKSKAPSRHSVAMKSLEGAAINNKNSIKERNHIDVPKKKHKSKGITSKKKVIQHLTSHQRTGLPHFTVNNGGPQHRIKSSNHSAAVKYTPKAYINLQSSKSTALRIQVRADTLISEGGGADNLSEYPLGAKKKPGSLDRTKALYKPEAVIKKDDSCRCPSFTEQHFPEGDHRRIRISPDLRPLPWLSDDDIQKMVLLAEGEVISKVRVPAHGQVLQVALDHPEQQQPPAKRDSLQHGPSHTHPEGKHNELCEQGHCSLIKRTDDWFEVFAFHLDRVLGINRSLPAVLRTFHSEILPYHYTNGFPRPAVWWDPDIQHLADEDNDQNSVPLSWVQYQKLLQVRCGREADQSSAPCMGVHHSEWGRLALFDFLLQVSDRLDRYCCGFTPDPTELCVENLLHSSCGNAKDLLLVHILVRKADPSRLVFIDNNGRPQQTSDNLNFRLVEGIDEFPEGAVSVLQSGCLESLLLCSLYTDKELWDSQGGDRGLRPLIQIVDHRGKILLQHIRDKKLQLKRDL